MLSAYYIWKVDKPTSLVCCTLIQLESNENSEDPDEMPQKAAFHQSLHCLRTQKQSSGTEI